MEALFADLERENYLVGRSKRVFAERAALYVNEINAVHQFIDGNGRAQRFWLRMLAQNAGFKLTLKSSDQRRWNEASRRGFQAGDNAAMAKLLEQRLQPLGEPSRARR